MREDQNKGTILGFSDFRNLRREFKAGARQQFLRGAEALPLGQRQPPRRRDQHEPREVIKL